jgi:hypothetical protein
MRTLDVVELLEFAQGVEQVRLVPDHGAVSRSRVLAVAVTTLGRSLLDPLAMVRSWAQRHIAEI